jgi:Ammonium Transporter Family
VQTSLAVEKLVPTLVDECTIRDAARARQVNEFAFCRCKIAVALLFLCISNTNSLMVGKNDPIVRHWCVGRSPHNLEPLDDNDSRVHFASHTALRFRNRFRVDDALDVFACHGVAGVVGAMLTGVFATTTVNAAGGNGLLAGNPRLLWVQALAVGVTIAFTAPMTALVMVCVRTLGSLRVSRDAALDGVDVAEHGELAYSDDFVPVSGMVLTSSPPAQADAA